MTISTDQQRIIDSVTNRAPGVLEEVLLHELFELMDEFFRDTNVWREDVVFTTVADQTIYEVDSEVSATMVRLLSLVGSAEQPVAATFEEPGVIILDTAPTTAEEHTASVSLSVKSLNSDDIPASVPAWIWRRYNNAIIDGLVGRLMAMPAKPYFNERLSIFHMRKFSDAKAQARGEAVRKNLYGAQNWRFPRFGV